MSHGFDHSLDQVTLLEADATKTAPPPMFKVVMLNDDFTPMEFVVDVLRRFFSKGADDAVQIMLSVHHQGRATCGVYPRDIASTKIEQVSIYAKQHQHPLQCILEEA